MPTRRHARTVKNSPTNPSDRASIPASHAHHVDTLLKDLRACAQQLVPLETSLNDELRILERLYYKGVNQHRAAVFWRRVEEARKLGKRIADMQLCALIEGTRYAFYVDEGAERQSKLLRTPWSRVPDMKFLIFVQKRILAAEDLLHEAIERLRKAYHSLELMLQTGAFLQTVLMLISVVSRLHTVSDELKACLSLLSCGLNTSLSNLKQKPHAPELTPQAFEMHDPSDNLSSSRHPPGQADLQSEPLLAPSKSIITYIPNPNPSAAQPKTKQEGEKTKPKELKKKKKRDAIDDIFASI